MIRQVGCLVAVSLSVVLGCAGGNRSVDPVSEVPARDRAIDCLKRARYGELHK